MGESNLFDLGKLKKERVGLLVRGNLEGWKGKYLGPKACKYSERESSSFGFVVSGRRIDANTKPFKFWFTAKC